MDNTCPFCDLTQVGERYIYGNGLFHVAATLGQITDGGYTIIFPAKHVPCIGAMAMWEATELQRLKQSIIAALEDIYKTGWVAFEHGIFGQSITHAHLHVLPFPSRLYPHVRHDFPDAQIVRLAGPEGLSRAWSRRSEPYLYWESSLEPPHVCWVGSAPDQKQYFRKLIACEMGRPDRADWRIVDPTADRKLYLETVARLKLYLANPCFC